jgi:hypothetical protein
VLSGRDDRCNSRNHFFAALIDGFAAEIDAMRLGEFLGNRQRDCYRITDPDGSSELQRLIEVYGSWTGKPGAKNGRDQSRSPHAVSYNAVENIVLGEIFVEMSRIDVAGDDREQLYILVGQHPHKACGLADLQFIERPICDRVHDTSFRLAENVIATIDVFDVARDGLSAIINEEGREASNILN